MFKDDPPFCSEEEEEEEKKKKKRKKLKKEFFIYALCESILRSYFLEACNNIRGINRADIFSVPFTEIVRKDNKRISSLISVTIFFFYYDSKDIRHAKGS